MARFSDSLTECMQAFSGLELDGEERGIAAGIGDELFEALKQIERRHAHHKNLCQLALAFAIFSAADGIAKANEGPEEGNRIILPH